MRFLITGLPRIRSAWMAALFSSDRVRCFHDAVHHGGVEKMLEQIQSCSAPIVGLIDPSAASVYPRSVLAMFDRCPIILINRHEEDCRTGLEKWTGWKLGHWDDVVAAHKWFLEQLGPRLVWVDYDDLDDFDTVAEIYRVCTGLQLDKDRFDLFNTLKIEQHFGKAEVALLALTH